VARPSEYNLKQKVTFVINYNLCVKAFEGENVLIKQHCGWWRPLLNEI